MNWINCSRQAAPTNTFTFSYQIFIQNNKASGTVLCHMRCALPCTNRLTVMESEHCSMTTFHEQMAGNSQTGIQKNDNCKVKRLICHPVWHQCRVMNVMVTSDTALYAFYVHIFTFWSPVKWHYSGRGLESFIHNTQTHKCTPYDASLCISSHRDITKFNATMNRHVQFCPKSDRAKYR